MCPKLESALGIRRCEQIVPFVAQSKRDAFVYELIGGVGGTVLGVYARSRLETLEGFAVVVFPPPEGAAQDSMNPRQSPICQSLEFQVTTVPVPLDTWGGTMTRDARVSRIGSANKPAGQSHCQRSLLRRLSSHYWLNFCVSGVANNVCDPLSAMIDLCSTVPGGRGVGDDEHAESKCCGTSP